MKKVADRQAMAKITADGVYLEQLETDPAKYLPEVTEGKLAGEVVQVDLGKPMPEILRQLSAYPVKTRVNLTGTFNVTQKAAAILRPGGRVINLSSVSGQMGLFGQASYSSSKAAIIALSNR